MIFRRRQRPRSDRIGAKQALKINPLGRWSAERTAPTALYDGPKLQRCDGVYAIGSCFARELEKALISRGGNVVNMDYQALDRPEFKDAEGRIRLGYFHRYTPQSMLLELRGLAGDELLFRSAANLLDYHYGWIEGADLSPEGTRTRRAIGSSFREGLARSKIVVLTLGLIEAWRHVPSGLYCNKVSLPHLVRRPDDFELVLTSVEEAVDCLDQMRALIGGDKTIVVTVSPVPMNTTFSGQDVVTANTESKATLRAAAAVFARRHDNVWYYPSYEMVMAAGEAAWREDRAHVSIKLVSRIVKSFMSLYFEDGDVDAPAVETHGLVFAD